MAPKAPALNEVFSAQQVLPRCIIEFLLSITMLIND